MQKINLQKTALCLALAACSASSAFALEAISDESLGAMTGQDGLLITSLTQKVAATNIHYEDNNGTAQRQLRLQGFEMAKTFGDLTAASPALMQSTAKINIGSDNSITGTPALNLSLNLGQRFINTTALQLCDAAVGNAGCGTTLGALAIETPNATTLDLSTTGGLFSKTGSAKLNLNVDGMNVYLTHRNATSGTSQLILGDIRLNMDAVGKLYIDAVEGVRFSGSANLNADTAPNSTRAGVQLNLMHRNRGAATNFSTAAADGANGLLGLGMSGRLSNLELALRGTNDLAALRLGTVDNAGTTSVVGTSGLALSLKADLTNTFSLQFGEVGAGGHGLKMSDFRTVDNINVSGGKFSLGNVYVNLVNTTKLALPDGLVATNVDNKIRLPVAGLTLGTQADYVHNVSASNATNSLAVMIRGADFQAIPKVTQFFQNASAPIGNAANWSLLPLLHNVNANLALYGNTGNAAVGATGTQDKIGFGLALSTQGKSADGSKSTTLGFINTLTNQYMGLRNIDLFAKADGDISITTTGIRLDLASLYVLLDAELAVGYLNGANQPNVGVVTGTFNNPNDVLVGVRARVNASGFLELQPNAADNSIGLQGSVMLEPANAVGAASAVYLVDSADKTTIALERITGRLNVQQGSKLDIQNDGLALTVHAQINPNNTAAEDLRIQDVGLYAAGGGGLQRLAEVAIPGGQLYARLKVTPVNIP